MKVEQMLHENKTREVWDGLKPSVAATDGNCKSE